MNTENNLIAEFIGWTFEPESQTWFRADFNIHTPFGFEFAYHNDWASLMAVVEKIERLGHRVEIGICKCKIYSANYDGETTYRATKILSVYAAVVDFIKWHNEQAQNIHQ